MNEKIDFIITWLDNEDIEWQKEKAKYMPEKNDESNSIIRYRNWDLLKYWFRSVEQNANWVNKIYFITYGHLPSWLNTKNDKLVIINHKDYIPKEYLPTFNSNVIEMFINRIPNVSEQFVYFNDDVLIVNKIEKDYFFEEGMPKDSLVFNAVSVNNKNSIIEHTILNDLEILSKHFTKGDVLKNNKGKIYSFKYGKDGIKSFLLRPWKYFTGIQNYHTAMPYLRSTWNKIWDLEKDELYKIGTHRFRSKYDINHWLIKYWQMFEGKFVPTSQKRNYYYDLQNNNDKFCKDLINKKYNVVCINDSNEEIDFDKVKEELTACLDKMFPNKSSFEK